MVETPTANQEALGYLQEHWEEMMEVVPDGMCCAFSTDFRRLVAWGADTREASERAGSMGPAFYAPNPIGAGRWGGKDTRQWIEDQQHS